MISKFHTKKMFYLSIIALIFAALACTINFGNDEDGSEIYTQQTLVALQMTQAALDAAKEDQPVQPPPKIEEVQPTEESPTEEKPEESPDILYEGIGFSFAPDIAQNAIPTTIQGQNLGEETMPGNNYPTHYEFTFNAYAVPGHFHTPIIIIYPVDDYRAISPYASDIIDNLKQTLINKPAGGSFSDLPFLPMWNAAQLFANKVNYFNFKNGSGVRYLTMYGQALWPVDNQNLFYTYQGITDDGQYYICAVLPIRHTGLPDEGQIDDFIAFEENWDTYIADTLAWLEGQDNPSFTPNLDSLDAMMASFQINR